MNVYGIVFRLCVQKSIKLWGGALYIFFLNKHILPFKYTQTSSK